MSTEIVRAHPNPAGGALSLGTMSPRDAWLFCESLADTPLLPDAYRRQPASVLWALEYGRALGLDVVTTITTIHVIKGKPTQSADLMLSRARSAGHRVRITPSSTSCLVSIWRNDDPEFENRIEWTLDDAVTAGLCEIRDGRPHSRSSKGEPQSWEKYPRAMLRSRAIAECVRGACPEVLHGAIYTPEELGARVDSEGLPMEAEVQQLRVVRQGESDPWATPAATVQAAVADIPVESLTPGGRDYLHEAMKASDAATVRLIWKDAQAEGARPEYLAQIAEVGKAKAAAPAPAPAEEVVEAEIVDDPIAAAEQQLRATAAKAGLDNLDEEFQRSYGIAIADAGLQQLTEMTQLLGGVAA
ncbi:hypothetical protein GCM10010493_50590 [Streptomyces lavendulae subsp. grasserius]